MVTSSSEPRPAPAGGGASAGGVPARALVPPALLAVLVALLWVFPSVWYTRRDTTRPALWLAARTNLPGWRFEAQPIDKSAEAQLAADSTFYGEYNRDGGGTVRLFTAMRWGERSSELALFVHTPDRCWTEAGWRIEPLEEDYTEAEVGGTVIGMERRLFVHPAGVRELVYFFGLVGGQPLPYRLDHNLGVGQRYRRDAGYVARGSRLRVADGRIWSRLWDSFASRRPLLGAKEFVRISAPVTGSSLEPAESLLRGALVDLLEGRRVEESAAVTGGGRG